MKLESETENEGLREYVKVLERVGYECGQLVRERWKLIALKSAIAKKRENTMGEQGKWLRIAYNDDMSVSLKKLRNFSGEMLRKSKRSMRRKSLLKISNEGESRKLKNRVGLKFPGNFSALFLKNIGKST